MASLWLPSAAAARPAAGRRARLCGRRRRRLCIRRLLLAAQPHPLLLLLRGAALRRRPLLLLRRRRASCRRLFPPKKPAEVEPQAVAAGWEGHPRALEPAAVVVAAASRGGARGQQRLACAAAACAQRRVRSQVAGDTVGLASGATTYIETEAVCTTGRRHRYPAGARPRAAPRRPCCCCCCCKGTCVPGGCRLPEAADFQRQLLWRPRHAPVWATKDEPGAMQEAQAAERSMAAHAAPLGWAQRSHPWAYAWPTCSKANGGRREGWNALLRGEATAGHPRAYVAWGPPACSTALTSAGEAEACPSARIPPACAPMPPQRIHPPACTAHQQAC